jgi:hypothetical protein
VKLLGGQVQAFFIDADIKFAANGAFTIIAKN